MAYHVPGYVLDHSPVYATGHPLENVVHVQVGAWLSSYHDHWWKIVGPILAYVGVVFCLSASISKHPIWSFWGSVIAVFGTISTAGFALFPFIVPSSSNPAQSLTVWNVTSSYYSLSSVLIITIVLLVVIIAYKIFAYAVVWRNKSTLTEADLKADPHTYY